MPSQVGNSCRLSRLNPSESPLCCKNSAWASLLPGGSGRLEVIASTREQAWAWASWRAGALLERVLAGEVVITVDTASIPEWLDQPVALRDQVGSAIYIPLLGQHQRAILVAVHAQRTRFDHRHKQMATRFKPLIAQAMARAEQLESLALANRDMRLVLDTVEQGMVIVDPRGQLRGQRSRRFIDWFGPGHQTLWDALGQADPRVAAWLQMSWEDLTSELMPLEVVLDQLPKQLSDGRQTWSLSYTPIGAASGPPESVLVTASDITEELAAAQAQRAQQEFAHAVTRLVRDRQSFIDFFEDTQALMARLASPQADLVTVMRDLHTLKGNSGLFHVQSVASCCHAIEGECASEQRGPTAQELERLAQTWGRFVQTIEPLIAQADGSFIELDEEDYDAFIRALERGQGAQQLRRIVESWRLAPVKPQLERLGEQAQALAQRLGKPSPEVTIMASGVRLDSERFRPFWSACVHVVRNAVDHGLEDEQTRQIAGKPAHGALTLRASSREDRVLVEIEDDGAGINWGKLQTKAAQRGLTVQAADELLFMDGLSSRDEATEVSGRGVGMGALKQVCEALGGRVEVQSQPGLGTLWRFDLPESTQAAAR